MKKIKLWLRYTLWLFLGLVLSIVIIGFVFEHISRFKTKRNIPLKGKFVNIGDHKLNINLRGKGGPLVVFESGQDAGGSLVWQKVQDEVSKFNATASYDRAGILFSETGNTPKTGEAIADELHMLLNKAGQTGPFIMVGHSAAGFYIRSYIKKYPNEVSGVVFVEASHPDQFDRMKEVFGSMEVSELPEGILKFLNRIGIVRLTMRNFAYPGTLQTDSINLITRQFYPKSFLSVSEEGKNAISMAQEVKGIKSFGDIPLIVITGTDTSKRAFFQDAGLALRYEKIFMELQKDLLTLSTNSEHVLADESGHYVQLQQPEIVVAAIQKILMGKR